MEIDNEIFLKPFNKEKIKELLIDKFLPEDFIPYNQKINVDEFNLEKIKEVELIGKTDDDSNLPISLLFIEHTGINDPRITITRESFKIVKSLRSKNTLVVFYTNNSPNYRISLITFTSERKGEKDVKEVLSNPKRYSYFLGPNTKIHTPTKNLIIKGRVKDEKDLRDRFSLEVVTKEFYQELANWYFWALKHVKFPSDLEAKNNGRNIGLIRFITRFIFIWFMKRKGLISDDLFNKDYLKGILKNLDDEKTTYYTAILQNLFFATLNTKIEERRFRKDEEFQGKNKDYMDHRYYRYHKLFKDPDKMKEIFNEIPFLNGGLFECLDKGVKDEDNETGKEIRIDGFSDRESKQPIFPNFLFFSDEVEVDLSSDYNDKKYKKTKVRGIINILNTYNFTVDENSSFDVDVSLDPELLGRVFENLLASYNPETSTTARKATGSYYTPREIVDYMVEESLKEYLKTKLTDDGIKDFETKLERLFSYEDEENPFDENQTERIINFINTLKVIDPAVGSGAFLMGMLQKLVFLLSKLDPHNKKWKDEQIKAIQNLSDLKLKEELYRKIEEYFSRNELNYGRKLYLIQNCLYGVDIQPIAIEIAKLRFFLSLLVDEKVDINSENFGIEPLPNLEFKLVCANSLIRLPTQNFYQQDFSMINQSKINNEDHIKKLKDLMDEYFLSYGRKKKKIEKEFREVQKNLYESAKEIKENTRSMMLAKWKPFDSSSSCEWFEPEWMFGIKDGFDIVIANPPYIQLQKDGGKLAKIYENQNYKTFTRTGDIYVLFYEKGIDLLKTNGVLCYITSNKWMRAGYGEKLREFFINYNPILLIDLGPGVFENATVDTNILLIKKQPNQNILKALNLKSTDKESINEQMKKDGVKIEELTPDIWFIGSQTEQKLKEKIEKIGKPLKDWDVKIYYGIKTGLNEAFIITTEKREEILKNCKDKQERKRTEEIIKPILRGRDIKRYYYEWAGLWVIFIPWHFPLHEDLSIQGASVKAEKEFKTLYSAIYKHLLNFKSDLIRRNKEETGIRYEWYALQRCAATYYSEFEKEKIIYSEIVREPQFCYDTQRFYIEATSFLMVGNHIKYLCGLLNSRAVTYFFKKWYSGGGLGEDGYRYKKVFLENVPLPFIAEDEKSSSNVKSLVDKILEIKKKNPNEDTAILEKQIDQLVYQLYNLTPEEIKIIENER